MAAESVGTLAELYLGNLLYALERCAVSLDAEDKPLDAAFYRGIGRKLAEAHGAARAGRPPGVPADGVPADGVPADGVPADGVPADGDG
jgi:hypothetical protein